MEENTYPHGVETAMFHAMIPSEMIDFGFVEVKMPLLFAQKGDDFERWYNEEKHVLLRDFEHEYSGNLMSKGNYYAKLIYDKFTSAWVKEEYYKDLIDFWESQNEKDIQSKMKALRDKNYRQADYLQEEIKKNKSIILKAKAALYFINQTKAFVKSDFGIPDIIPPVSTSTELKEPTKNPKTNQAQKNYVAYTNKYIDFCKCVRPNYNRESAIRATLKEFNISERTLARALDSNRATLLKFGHKEKNFKIYSRVKWS